MSVDAHHTTHQALKVPGSVVVIKGPCVLLAQVIDLTALKQQRHTLVAV